MPMKLFVGDVVELRKPHPCGGSVWEIQRTGIDFRIKCQKCGHSLMLSRIKLEKGIKRVIKSQAEVSGQSKCNIVRENATELQLVGVKDTRFRSRRVE